MMLNDCQVNPEKSNWASSVRNLLSNYGFMDVWLAQGVGNTNIFLKTFNKGSEIASYRNGIRD